MDKKRLTKLIAFLAMSDGSLIMHEGCVNASFALTLSDRNEDLIDFAGNLMNEIGVGWKKKPTGGKYARLSSKTHPFLTTLWNRTYQMGRKVPSPHDFKLLDWEAMAILFMCDGNIQWGGGRQYPMLNLCRWSYAELCWVKQQIKERLGIDTNVYKCGKYYRLGVPAKDCDAFFEGVRPFVLPSFSYKLPNGEPLEIEGDEIVRPVVRATELGGNALALVTT